MKPRVKVKRVIASSDISNVGQRRKSKNVDFFNRVKKEKQT
jgi:hypothetical protein